MAIDTKLISQLRQMTGAGISDCREALEQSGGDLEKAVEFLRKKGATKAAKKIAERQAGEGIVESYIHDNKKIGVLLELRCETDFVARNEDFKKLAHELALQIAAFNPSYIKPEDVTAEDLAKEKEVYAEQLAQEGKPADMIDKIVEGKLQKYFEEVCLLKQPYVKDDKVKIEDLISQYIAKLGEKIEVTRFSRFQI